MTATSAAIATPTRPAPAEPRDGGPHILLVAGDQKARFTLAEMLLTANCRLTLCASHDVADTLYESESPFHLLIAAQPVEAWTGVATLARAVTPHVPILLLEDETASGPGVLAAVQSAIARWAVVH